MESTVIYEDSGTDITILEKPQVTSSTAISKTAIDDNCSSFSDVDAYWEDFDSALMVTTVGNDSTKETIDEEWLIETEDEVGDSVAPPDELKEVNIEISNQGISENPELNIDEEPTQPLVECADRKATVATERLHTPSNRKRSKISSDSILRRSNRHPQPLIEFWTNKALPRKPMVLTYHEHARVRKYTKKEKKMLAKCQRENQTYERYISRINKTT